MTQIQVSQSLEVRWLDVANLCGEMAWQGCKVQQRALDSGCESAQHTVMYFL